MIVEDGTGLVNSDSYVSIVEIVGILTAQLPSSTFASLTDTPKQEGIVKTATFQIDNYLKFRGTPVSPTQALRLPRIGLEDQDCRPLTGVPYIFKVACSLQCEFLVDEDWRESLEQGVTSVQVGPIDVKFDRDFVPVSSKLPLDPAVVQLLSPYTSVLVNKSINRSVKTRRLVSV